MKKILVPALCALALTVPHLATRAADTFWVPLHDGQTLLFLQSGSILNSDGSSSQTGRSRSPGPRSQWALRHRKTTS